MYDILLIIDCHVYADDIQLYTFIPTSCTDNS